MKNPKDDITKIVPSKTREGQELSSSATLESPSVLSKLATPPPTINSDMLQVIDDATSTANDASTLLDDTMPLGEFLDKQLARAKEIENVETENYETPIRCSSP